MTDSTPTGSPANNVPLGAVITRGIIQSAIDLLRHRYRLRPEQAFQIIKTVSQVGNIKVRTVASQLLVHDATLHGVTPLATTRAVDPPRTTFTDISGSLNANRSDVLAALMFAVRELAEAPRATVQSVDPIHQGLLIERHLGFERRFLDYFSYLDAAETTCGAALIDAQQVLLADVADYSTYSADGLATMLDAGARCVVSTPLRNDHGQVVGVVSIHHPSPGRLPDEIILEAAQRYADEAGQWLQWHDARIMPLIVDAVHTRAAGHH